MSSEAILKVGVTAGDVDTFIRTKLLPATENEPLDLMIASSLTLIISSLGPDDLTEDELFKAVEEVSAALILAITSIRQTPSEVN